ncbi:MAG: recombinase family protein [Candidatus Wildermuthbacteria bacterium]|nr:recombinase family protein [Candidatus Wildermuthbacteria bacterium]
MKAVIYCRVSSKEQEETGYSLPAQEKLLIEYAQRRSLTILKEFSVAESASGAKQRKVFEEMIEFMKKKDIPVLLCEKVDRLTRNLKEAVVANDWIEADEKRQIHFVKQNLVIHKNAKSDEKFRWDIEIVLAKKFISNLSEEVKKGQEEKIAQGWLPTKPPLGYKTIGDKGHKIHVIDEEKAPSIRKMFEMYSSGNYSLKAVNEILHKEGLRNVNGRRIAKSRIHQLISDPFYYGKIRWKGEIYKGSHEPLISQELFDEVQQKLKRKTAAPRYTKHLPVFKAKIQCEECSGTITWEIQKGHWYGHCNHYKNCSQKTWLRQERVEEQLFPYFDKVAPKNTRIMQWLEKALKESHADEINYNANQRNELTKIVADADRRIEGSYRDKLDGRIEPTLCKKMMSDATKEKEAALDALQELSEGRTSYYEAGYAIHELAIRAKDIYQSEKTTTEEKRMLLGYVFSNLEQNEDKIKPNYTLAFEFLANWLPKLNKTFEPQFSEQKGAFDSNLTSLLRR